MQTVAEHADLRTVYERRLAPCMRHATYVLRITEWKARRYLCWSSRNARG